LIPLGFERPVPEPAPALLRVRAYFARAGLIVITGQATVVVPVPLLLTVVEACLILGVEVAYTPETIAVAFPLTNSSPTQL
jgi:hypothetical protein